MVLATDDAFPKARLMFEAGALQQAETLCHQILRKDTDNANVLDLLGLVALRRKDFGSAVELLTKAIHCHPDVADYHIHLGQALRAAGDLAAAIVSCQESLRLSPGNDYANNCLGLAFMAASRIADAFACFDAAVQAAPGNGEAHNNRGIALFQLERYEEAVASYEQASTIDPAGVGPLTNLGSVFLVLGRDEEAEACFLKVLRIAPRSSEGHHNLGNVYKKQGKLEQAATSFVAAIRLNSGSESAHRGLGAVREQQERFREASSSYRIVEARHPANPLRCLRSMTMCPTVFAGNEAIDSYRRRLITNIQRLARSEFQIDLCQLANSAEAPPFNLMYRGRNDLPIKTAYASIFQDRMPKMSPLSADGKPRLGFVVTPGHERAFVHCMGHVVNQLGRFDVAPEVVCTARSSDLIRAAQEGDRLKFALIPSRLDRAAEAIREYRFDLIYYWEVGSDTTNYLLPHLRLAPIQCTGWGVPVTTGIPTVDYYLSSRALEADSNADDYTEQLINLETLPTWQPQASTAVHSRSRESFGFSAHETIYLCTQNLAKVHPDFDALVGDILRTDAAGRVVFLADRLEYAAERLHERLGRSVPDVARRIRFLPRLEAADYRHLLSASDVVLDTIHYGGVMTTYDALALAKPIVTLAGCDQRGRYAAACYRQMGIADCTATSTDEYVAIATRLGREPDYRQSIVDQLADTGSKLFADSNVVPAYADVFQKLLTEIGRI